MHTPRHDKNIELKRQLAQKKARKVVLAQTQDSGQTLLANTRGGYRNLSINEKAVIEDGKIITDPVIMTNKKNCQYMVKLAVGCSDQKQEFLFILDTGSTTILLIGQDCKSTGCLEHNIYKQSPQCSFKFQSTLSNQDPNEVSSIHYGMGMVKFKTNVDDFHFNDFVIENQPFAEVVSQDQVFDGAYYDGLIGFGYPGLGTQNGIVPVFDNIMKSGKLKHNAFCLFVSRLGSSHSKFFLGGCP